MFWGFVVNWRRLPRYLLLLFCYVVLAAFLVVSVLYVFLDYTTAGVLVAIFYPGIAPLLSLGFITCGVVIIRFSFMRNLKGRIVVYGLCGFLFVSAVMPYAALPLGVSAAEAEMVAQYGADYLGLDTSQMRPVPFSVFDLLYGFPIDESRFSVETDIRYLDNGEDSFFFDWYKPVGAGPFPVVICLHGGGYVIGNKGVGNVIPFNKYLAQQGYVVFDLQYGLFDIAAFEGDTFEFISLIGQWRQFISPAYNRSYTIQEMVENIGYFTQVLEQNSTRYHADMNNVFVVGRSAGAHMASIVTLGYKNSLFLGNFSSTMNITAGIWFYPPTNMGAMSSEFTDALMAGSLPLEDQYDKFSARYLIQNSTVVPPIMIVHGSKDKLVDYQTQGVDFVQYARSLGRVCLLITIPWGGHGFDINFQTYGGQMSTYNIERFMALVQLSGGP
ncbi:MAG: alpha/beta hydrolase [Promethearchaeota archaeon]